MLKRTKVLSKISLFIAIVMMLSVFSFADSSEKATESQVSQWVNKGWTRLYEGQEFQPEKNLTRGELVALINALFEFKEQNEINFSDVAKESPYYKEVAKAFNAGYISGKGNNIFGPDDEVNRIEAYIMMAKALKLNRDLQPHQMLQFKDADEVPTWGQGAVEALAQKGYINDKNKVKPFEKLKGSEAVALLEKIMPVTEEASQEEVITEEKTKGGGKSPLNLLDAYFVSIVDGQVVDLEKIQEGNSSEEIIIKLVFDRGIVRDNWEHNQQQIKLQANNGSIIDSEVFRIEGVEEEKSHIFIKPLEKLKSGKTVKIVIGKDLMANNGNTLGNEEVLSFTVK